MRTVLARDRRHVGPRDDARRIPGEGSSNAVSPDIAAVAKDRDAVRRGDSGKSRVRRGVGNVGDPSPRYGRRSLTVASWRTSSDLRERRVSAGIQEICHPWPNPKRRKLTSEVPTRVAELAPRTPVAIQVVWSPRVEGVGNATRSKAPHGHAGLAIRTPCTTSHFSVGTPCAGRYQPSRQYADEDHVSRLARRSP